MKVLEGNEGEVVGVKFVDFVLEAKYKDNPLCNTQGGKISILKLGMMVEKGE